MSRRTTSRGALVLMCGLAGVVCQACIETAVSAEERMVIACRDFAEALEATSERGQLDQLKEATHWADLAERKEEELEFVHDALDRLVQQAEGEIEDRDGRVIAEAVQQVRGECEPFSDTDGFRRRLRSGALEIDTLR